MLQRFPSPGSLLPVGDVQNKVGGRIQGTTAVGGMGYCSGISRGNYCANTATTGHFSAAGTPLNLTQVCRNGIDVGKERPDLKGSARGFPSSCISCGGGKQKSKREGWFSAQ